MEELTLPNQISIELPTNEYEQIMYLESLAVKLNETTQKVTELIEILKTRHEGDESDAKYHLVDVFDNRKTTLIDEKGLKFDNPELYRNCLSITGANAMKLIGEDKMWTLCLKYAGEERTVAASNLTLKQMKKCMTDEEYAKYTTEIYKKKGVEVAVKE